MPGRYNEILVGRYNRFLQKFLSMKGGPPAPQLASELSATWAMFHGAENRYLEGWNRFCAAATIAAGGAGNFSVAQLTNLAGSNVIAVIEKILIVAGASDLFLIRQALGIGNLPSIVTTVPLDTRWGTSSTLTFSTRNTTVSQGAGSTIAVLGAQPANAQTELISTDIDEIPCLPGTSYNVTANNTNEAMQVTFMWRERSLEESERA